MSDPGDGCEVTGAEQFAGAWAKALRGSCLVPMVPEERTALLTALTRQLAGALTAEPFDQAAGHRVGTELVTSGFTAPEALGRTITAITTHFITMLGLPDSGGELAALVEQVAVGFTAAAHDRDLDMQEAIRMAALNAHDRVERALRASEERFRHLASHDPLTGLPNRMLFTSQLTELVETAAPDARIGVCCVDLDGFEAVNDSLGHRLADRLLIRVAERLSSLDRLMARLDGDKFAILIEGTTCAEDAVKVADRALHILTEPLLIDDHELHVTASAGVVEQPAASADPAELIRAADVALHWAKADGKARWRLFEPERSAQDVARYRLSAAMPAALRRGEFFLAYQPLVDLTDSRLTGVEALVRWQHPELGLLGPDKFVDLACDTGLIVPLGIALLERACRQAVEWGQLYVSVNLAPAQLRHPGLVADVVTVLDRTGLDTDLLQLEITEEALIGDDPAIVAALRAFADLGVRVVIDDFGTGYANLACLYTLPLYGIKLAASIVNAGPPTADFLATVVSLGHSLGLHVTAEGIEEARQAALLRAVGCDTGQGYYFGHPGPPDTIAKALRHAG